MVWAGRDGGAFCLNCFPTPLQPVECISSKVGFNKPYFEQVRILTGKYFHIFQFCFLHPINISLAEDKWTEEKVYYSSQIKKTLELC